MTSDNGKFIVVDDPGYRAGASHWWGEFPRAAGPAVIIFSKREKPAMSEQPLEKALREVRRATDAAGERIAARPTVIILVDPTEEQKAAARYYMTAYYPDKPLPEGS